MKAKNLTIRIIFILKLFSFLSSSRGNNDAAIMYDDEDEDDGRMETKNNQHFS